MKQHAYLIVKIGFDTEESGPFEVRYRKMGAQMTSGNYYTSRQVPNKIRRNIGEDHRGGSDTDSDSYSRSDRDDHHHRVRDCGDIITLSEARSRLDRRRFSRLNMHFSAVFKLYKKIILSQAKLQNFAKFRRILQNFDNILGVL